MVEDVAKGPGQGLKAERVAAERPIGRRAEDMKELEDGPQGAQGKGPKASSRFGRRRAGQRLLPLRLQRDGTRWEEMGRDGRRWEEMGLDESGERGGADFEEAANEPVVGGVVPALAQRGPKVVRRRCVRLAGVAKVGPSCQVGKAQAKAAFDWKLRERKETMEPV